MKRDAFELIAGDTADSNHTTMRNNGAIRIKQPTQQELIIAILAAWKRNEGGQGIPHEAWAVFAAHAVEILMGWKPK